MELVTPAGRRVIVNRDAVVTIEPAMDGQTKTPIIGQATLLLNCPLPNLPGATPFLLVVNGDYRDIAVNLGLCDNRDLVEDEDVSEDKG